MPSNLYGVANAPIITALAGQLQTVVAAGSTTNVVSSPAFIAPSQGFYYPAIFWWIDITFGASIPTLLQFGFRIGSGSSLDAAQFETTAMNPNVTVNFTIALFGPASSVPWQAPGSIINGFLAPTVNSVTSNSGAGRAWFALFRAPDQ